MKKLLATLLFSLGLIILSQGQTWTRMQGWGLDLEASHWVTNQKVVAVGENLIIYSENGGSTWTEVGQEFGVRLNDVTFSNESTGIAVGELGTIHKTTDGGKTWAKISSGTVKNLKSVIAVGSSQLFAAGEDGTLLSSTNSGTSWSLITTNTTLDFQEIIFANENLGFIAAEGGNVFRSTNKGVSWEKIQLSTVRNLNGVLFTSALNGYVVGDLGTFFRTTDGGTTWTALVSNVTSKLKKVAASPVDNRILIAVGEQATLIRSANSGTNFGTINLGTGNVRNLNHLGFIPTTNTLFAFGQNGYIISSTNAGSNWTTRQAGVRNDFTVTDFKSTVYGFIAGNSGTVFVTSNGGQTIISRSLPESTSILGMEFWNTNYGFVTGENGVIYRTGNAGSSWIKLNTNISVKIKGIHIFLPEVPYVVGEKGLIARTFTSGNDWQLLDKTNTTKDLNDISAFDLQTAFAVGNNGQISWSNNGVDWENIFSGTTENLNFATRLNETTAVAVGENGVILKTSDKARSWQKIETGFQQNLNSVDFFDSQFGFAVGDSGFIIGTKDGGETWFEMNSATIRDLVSVSAPGPTIAFAVGNDGTILNYSCTTPGSLSPISGNSTSCLGTSTYSITSQPELSSEIVWRVDGGVILSGQGSPTIEIEWTTPGRNAVLVSRSNFCGNGETSFMEVLVNPAPAISTAISGEGTVCINSIQSYSVPSQTGSSYTWEVSGGEIQSGQGTANISVRWTTSGDHRISVIASSTCGKSEPTFKSIKANKAPDQPAAIAGEAITPLGQFTYQTTSIPGLNYKWSISGGGKIISGQGTATITVNWEQEGQFEVSVEAQNECNFGPKRALNVIVNIITALEPTPALGKMTIYPNPSQGQITIQSANLDAFESIEVINSLGQVIYRSNISLGEKRHDLEALPRGVLYIQLSGKNGMNSHKVIVR